MKRRWWWWVLALSPALAGAISFALELGDLRTSGIMAGVSISIGLIAILLLLGAPWRGTQGIRRWVSVVPGLMLGLVSLLGLSEGLPEFFEARGLFIAVDSVGPVKVLAHDHAVVIVGNDREGGSVWVSEDGSNWTSIDDEALAELELVDGITDGLSMVVVGRSADPTEGVALASEDGQLYEETGRFKNSEFGTAPIATSVFRGGLVVVSDIIGNDVEFHTSDNYQTWTPAQPAPVFDDGESARDIACSEEGCVGVGFFDATYRSDLETNSGVAWVSTTGEDFQPVAYEFNTETLDAIPWNASGFLVVSNSTSDRGVAWHSADGSEWRPVSGPFNGATVDGVEAVAGAHIVFGHNPISGQLIMWRSEDVTNWTEAVVATDLPERSELRSVTSAQTGLIAVGINAETLDTLVWTSHGGNSWQQTAVITTR